MKWIGPARQDRAALLARLSCIDDWLLALDEGCILQSVWHSGTSFDIGLDDREDQKEVLLGARRMLLEYLEVKNVQS